MKSPTMLLVSGRLPNQNVLPQPQILIEGEPLRNSTIHLATTSNGLPIIDENDERSPCQLLRAYAVDCADKSRTSFWPFQLLCQILTRKRILAELKSKNITSQHLNIIRPEDTQFRNPSSQTYLMTFALLIHFDRVSDIGMFIEEKVSDQNLPLHRDLTLGREVIKFCRRDNPSKHLTCFTHWKYHEQEGFERDQWRVLVPYFDLDDENRAKHQNLDRETILPWCKNDGRSQSSSQRSVQEGGYAFVSRIKIDRSSHGFSSVLEKIGFKDDYFALKVLRDEDFNNKQEQFQNELEQLKRFNGLVHDHLITLLATFTFDQKYHFLFPYADSTLDQYWESEKTPSLDLATIRWVSKQCSGIMGAMDCIHDPKHLSESKYGRHGDIKPDNILWFKSSKDSRGILVVSDMGLSSFNRDTSRSNIPNTKIPAVPGYRPPECDLKGGTISRAYDIWTLGCLFLELLTWLLGGSKFVERFQEERKSIYITGSINNIFFDIKEVTGHEEYGVQYVAQVKIQVTEWFNRLHSNKHCSQFIHDALDLIEKQMLVVLAEDQERAKSGNLRKKFEEFHAKCMGDKCQEYCLKAVPRPRKPARAATVVEANLNEHAINAIRVYKPQLPAYDPAQERKMRRSMRPAE